MHSNVMYGQVEHETGKGRRSGFTVSAAIANSLALTPLNAAMNDNTAAFSCAAVSAGRTSDTSHQR